MQLLLPAVCSQGRLASKVHVFALPLRVPVFLFEDMFLPPQLFRANYLSGVRGLWGGGREGATDAALQRNDAAVGRHGELCRCVWSCLARKSEGVEVGR